MMQLPTPNTRRSSKRLEIVEDMCTMEAEQNVLSHSLDGDEHVPCQEEKTKTKTKTFYS